MRKALLVFALAALPAVVDAAPVTVKGSDTMVILVQRWAEAFMKKHPEASVQVTGGGSGTGIAALVNGTTVIAASSRSMKPAEAKRIEQRFKAKPVEIPVAKDGVAFYVHESNPISSLTIEQLRSIYLGDIRNWKEVGGEDAPIVLYSRENSSGTYMYVMDELLQGEDFSPRAQSLPGTAAVVNAVAREKRAIGYGGAAYAAGIKELKVKKDGKEYAPTLDAVRKGEYPLSRDLYFYLRGPATGDVKAFIDFALSPEGQKIVSEVGYFPLK